MNDTPQMNEVLQFVQPQIPAWREVGCIPGESWQTLAGLVPVGTGDLAQVYQVVSCLMTTRDIGVAGAYAINEICARLLIVAGAIDLLPAVRRGEIRLAMDLTEPHSGSDIVDMRTRVTPGPPPVINGHKTFISNGTVADVHIVAARSGDGGRLPLIDLYRVDRDQLRITDMQGRGAALMRLADVDLVNVPAPDSCRIGRPGRGFAYLNQVLMFERAVIGCLATQFARVLLEDLGAHLGERKIFGSPLSQHGYHRLRLGDWWAEYRVLRSATEAMVLACSRGTAVWQDVFAVKLCTSAFVRRLAVDVAHLGGAASWVAGGPWAGLVDDARWFCLAGGASEVLQERLARDGLKPVSTVSGREASA